MRVAPAVPKFWPRVRDPLSAGTRVGVQSRLGPGIIATTEQPHLHSRTHVLIYRCILSYDDHTITIMAPVIANIPDHWLWLGLGASFYSCYCTILTPPRCLHLHSHKASVRWSTTYSLDHQDSPIILTPSSPRESPPATQPPPPRRCHQNILSPRARYLPQLRHPQRRH
jgi:hypothetical protein